MVALTERAIAFVRDNRCGPHPCGCMDAASSRIVQVEFCWWEGRGRMAAVGGVIVKNHDGDVL